MSVTEVDMERVEKISKDAERKYASFMSGKPIWVYWVFFTALVAVALGVSYATLYLLAMNWWVVALVVIVAGMSAGTFAYLSATRPDGGGKE